MIQLKVKTEYDFLQTYGPVKKVVAAAQGDAVAITDPNTWGHIAFYNECKKQGKKAILGVQICVVDEFTKDKQFNFMTFLAKNDEGLKELYHLISKANSNFYYVPRIRYSDVAKISTNIVVICGQGHTLPKLGHREVWLNLSPEYTAWNQQAVSLAKQHKLKLVVTSDVNYPTLADRQAYEVLAGQFANKKTTPQHILNTLAELKMAIKVPEDVLVEAIHNTHVIASQCNVTLPFAQTVHIEPELPIAKMCEAGLKKRLASYKKRGIKYDIKVYQARLKRELELIAEKGFEDYFYLVADMIDHAKETMLVGPARGSSAGSLVCWLTGITEVDPIPFDLMFERFIDITRKDLPDIDIDFPDLKREGVIEYLRDKYGKDNVAHLGTISRYKPKSAIGDVSKVLNIPAWETKDVKNAIIERSGGDARSAMCIVDTFESLDIGKSFIEKHPQMLICGEIEGHARHTGVHAAGIIVCNDPVKNYCGVNKDDTAMVDKYDAEKIGMLKIDALGLRTLTVLQDCIELVGMTREELYEVDYEDKRAFDVLNSNKFAGIFQFEGYAVQTLTKQMGIEEFNDIVALTALARPGPLHCGGATAFISRRTGKENVSYLHPLLEPYTNDTLGIVVYQEQVMAIVKNIGDFSWEETTVIRKAMSKSLGDEFFNQYKEKFIKGCTSKKMKADMADTIWKNIMTFGSWAFNKCLLMSTKVRMGATGGSTPEWVTIEELYDKYVENPSAWCKGRMPVVQSLYPDGRIRPQKVKAIHKNGTKAVNEYTFSNGAKISCTKDHKFIIDGSWQPISAAVIGSEFTAGCYEPTQLKTSTRKGSVKGVKYVEPQEGFVTGEDNPSWVNGKTPALNAFAETHQELPCQICGKPHRRMEIHHKVFNGGNIEPSNLVWCCPSCHKKEHYANGRTKRWGKGHTTQKVLLIAVSEETEGMTYDLEMEEHHNFVIDGGVITHNSHAVSYALVSYLCMWLKAYHPLEYAAASLANAKDEDSSVKLLRELVHEGYNFVPFDKDLSEVSWSIKAGALVGGFTSIKGVGQKTAEDIVRRRKLGVKFTPGQLKLMENPKTPWGDIFEGERRFSDYYENPEKYNIKSAAPVYIKNIQGDGHFVFLGKLKEKNQRDLNEYQSVQKRGGRIIEKNNLFLNFTVEDDTDSIICTIDRFKYQKLGKPIVEEAKIGDWYLFVGVVKDGWRKVYIDKLRRLEE